ncbi:DUF2075 domain-containing protein [Ramlibacter ginsenosidimutans]|uniref:DUF2075 domain-containing protein n=1 Tax=Ramlibacter ginsenosidimutans TaxID=502333 RepID=A0A934TQX4_9BURK|nr:DNA/RNA helicase domain-containing protein [Ramlibacter ginsenosidimutans]MBK6005638.1 DUF2075 domain-containing protein [Ramlibacter ginsenosidimutans]
MTDAIRGWDATFCRFTQEELSSIVGALASKFAEAGDAQVRAWKDSIPRLQSEVQELTDSDSSTGAYTAVLEYQLPLEYRRADAVFLLRDAVVVIELKGKTSPNEADLDQAQAYARDLRAYHAECGDRPVHAVLVPTRANGSRKYTAGVYVCPPMELDQLLRDLDVPSSTPIQAERFLSQEAYRPLPTLVKAARELFTKGTLRHVKRASAATEPATECVLQLTRQAAQMRRRKLILLSGVPGAGKTLVGLRLVHSHEIDEWAIARGDAKPTAPAVFLSGNGPLVEVLSYELRDAGGNGKTFVRGVKQYVERYLSRPNLVPSEHVLVYDEAQRAYDAAMVAEKHGGSAVAKSEPELFIEFAERVPEWCVVVALVGTGQEIHTGEEAGIGQWADAIRASAQRGEWDIHGPAWAADAFAGLTFTKHDQLNLDKSLRSHLSHEAHRLVAGIVALDVSGEFQSPLAVAEGRPDYLPETVSKTAALQALAATIVAQGHQLKITRDLARAKQYMKDRYAGDPLARYGLVASSRDRSLAQFGVPNDFQSTKRSKFGPWYGDGEDAPGGLSCRHLTQCVTEFGAQGLELDGAILAWGTDFLRKDGRWSNERASRYKRGGAPVHNPMQLRANAYRVLLTRARDGTVVFVPPLPELDETFHYLKTCGFHELSALPG